MAAETTTARERKANPLNAVRNVQAASRKANDIMSRSENDAGDIFFNSPQKRMQNKLHTMMYSGGTDSVNESVSLDTNSLIPTQSKIYSSTLSRYLKPRQFDDYPIVATYKGKNYIIDGHHRIAAEILNGSKKVKVKQYVMK